MMAFEQWSAAKECGKFYKFKINLRLLRHTHNIDASVS